MIITDLKNLLEDSGLCMFPDLRDNSNILHAVDHLSIVTSGRVGPLPLLIFIMRLPKHWPIVSVVFTCTCSCSSKALLIYYNRE